MRRFDKRMMIFLLTLSVAIEALGSESTSASYAEQVIGFWRELGTSMTLDGELDPGKDFWYFDTNGTLATRGTAMFEGPQPYSIDGSKISSEAVGGTYTIVSLEGDRMVLSGPLGGFWHLERRHFDPSEEHSGRYYAREQVVTVMAETVCVGMSNLGADKAVLDAKLAERLKLQGMAALDKEKFEASSKYYLDDPAFVTQQSTLLSEKMRSCMKTD